MSHSGPALVLGESQGEAAVLVLLLAIQATDVPQDVNVNVRTCRICDVVSFFRGDPKKRHEKAVGKLLANGNCVGAEKYALENGEFELADRVKARCESTEAPAQPTPQLD